MSPTLLKCALILIGVVALLLSVVLALPVQQWRTGEAPQPDLQYTPTPREPVRASRVWIDADAACGTGPHRDPDDCLAVLSLASAPGIHIAGLSTVFGNAPVTETDGVMRALVRELGPPTTQPCSSAMDRSFVISTPCSTPQP